MKVVIICASVPSGFALFAKVPIIQRVTCISSFLPVDLYACEMFREECELAKSIEMYSLCFKS